MKEYKGLLAPLSYTTTPQEIKDLYCNGCGTKGWKGWVVPETAWGLSLTRACNIHDWMYEHGRTEADKREADDVFLKNMRRLVKQGTPWLYVPRGIRAYLYYLVVKKWGDSAFWEGKG